LLNYCVQVASLSLSSVDAEGGYQWEVQTPDGGPHFGRHHRR
jgi:hypothetical protein